MSLLTSLSLLSQPRFKHMRRDDHTQRFPWWYLEVGKLENRDKPLSGIDPPSSSYSNFLQKYDQISGGEKIFFLPTTVERSTRSEDAKDVHETRFVERGKAKVNEDKSTSRQLMEHSWSGK